MKNAVLWNDVVTSRSDDARLAYMHWLDAKGEHDRSRFLLCQMAIARTLALDSGSAATWRSTAWLEFEMRTLLRRNLRDWQRAEAHTSVFHWKGFPARVEIDAVTERTLAQLRSIPVEHVVLLEPVDPSILDHLRAARVRALSFGVDRPDLLRRDSSMRSWRAMELYRALCQHPLVHELVWLRNRVWTWTRENWDELEAVAPRRLLYVDPVPGDALSLESTTVIDDPGALDYTGTGTVDEVAESDLGRPCWRCPSTTWGPTPTLSRVLGCADAVARGVPAPKPGAFAKRVSHWGDVVIPGIDFRREADPDPSDRTWDPESEYPM